MKKLLLPIMLGLTLSACGGSGSYEQPPVVEKPPEVEEPEVCGDDSNYWAEVESETGNKYNVLLDCYDDRVNYFYAADGYEALSVDDANYEYAKEDIYTLSRGRWVYEWNRWNMRAIDKVSNYNDTLSESRTNFVRIRELERNSVRYKILIETYDLAQGTSGVKYLQIYQGEEVVFNCERKQISYSDYSDYKCYYYGSQYDLNYRTFWDIVEVSQGDLKEDSALKIERIISEELGFDVI